MILLGAEKSWYKLAWGKSTPGHNHPRGERSLGVRVPGEGTGPGCSGGDGLCWGIPQPRRAPAGPALCVCTVTYCKRNVNVSQQINSAHAKKPSVETSTSQQSVVSARFAVRTPISRPASVSSECPVFGETSGRWGCDRWVVSTCRDSFGNPGLPSPGDGGEASHLFPILLHGGKQKRG